MNLCFCGYTDKGKVREINQDAMFMCSKEDVGIFVVADGMGGHTSGEKASAIIVQKLEKWWRQFERTEHEDDFLTVIEDIRICIEQANYEIYMKYNKSDICGSTVVVLFIYKNRYCIFSCGDSRIYSMIRWKLEQITIDDVWENQAFVMQSYSKKQRQSHSDRGKLLNAVGISSQLKIRMETGFLRKSQKFLLCSDGIYKMLSKRCIQYYLWLYSGKADKTTAVKRIKKRVFKQGAKDNFSVILVKCA